MQSGVIVLQFQNILTYQYKINTTNQYDFKIIYLLYKYKSNLMIKKNDGVRDRSKQAFHLKTKINYEL